MGLAALTVFQCITLEGWTDVMYYVSALYIYCCFCLSVYFSLAVMQRTFSLVPGGVLPYLT